MPHQVLGRESLRDVVVLERPEESLILWARMRMKAALPVVYCAAGNSVTALPADHLEKIQARVAEALREEGEALRGEGAETVLSSGNYLSAAVRLGIARKIYWVLPYRLLEYSDAERRIKMYLNGFTPPFAPRDIDRMKQDAACVSGRLDGVEVTVCSPETLPPISGPVLLSVDASFPALYASQRKHSNLRGLKEFFDIMAAKGLQVASAHVTLTGGTLRERALHRYLGVQVAEALKDVSLLSAQAPPDLWAVRDRADATFSAGLMEETREHAGNALQHYPDDEALTIFHATASAVLGRRDAAYVALDALCRRAGGNCHALLYGGVFLSEQGDQGGAEQWLGRIVRNRPQWKEAQEALARLNMSTKANDPELRGVGAKQTQGGSRP